MAADTDRFRSGVVALVGRPNVGKSTLLNALLGQKISIVTRKPQTTRHRILGILTRADGQVVFVDTPGIHRGPRRALNRYMNRTAIACLREADFALLVVEALRWTDDDKAILEAAQQAGVPVGLVVNKVDRVRPRSSLLPFLATVTQQAEFRFVVPLSARTGENLEPLVAEILSALPQGAPLFPEDQLTDRSERFLVAELVREQLIVNLRQEIPYGLTVQIEQFEEEGERLRIAAVIWVERETHKAIVIGQGGRVLKRIGRAARQEIAELLQRRVHLELWVKVKEGWTDRPGAIQEFGYH